MKKLVFGLILLAALVGGIGAAAWVIDQRTRSPYRGYTDSERFVEIPTGASTRAIGEALVAGGIVRDAFTFRVALWLSGEARHLQAGEYQFSQAMTPREVIAKIARGGVYVVSVTFPEGLTIAEMARIAEAHGFGPAADFIAAAQDPAPVRAFDSAAGDLEGYLFPDTYPLSRRTTPRALVGLMVDRFQAVFTPDLREAASARHLSVRQAVTLASIVEKETGRGDERPLVAAVYANRLRIGMALQCDPTVIYALARAGRYRGNLRRDDLQFDSPYNTYRYPGLPPGPIASPGRASLEAALRPAKVDFLYFVSRNDGTHAFSRTLAEHGRNVQKFQVQYFRANRAAGR